MNERKVKELLSDFHEISGMEIALINSHFHNIFLFSQNWCDYCSTIHQSSNCLNICKKSDECALKHASLENEMFLYSCPFGFVCAIAPIVVNKKTLAYIMLSIGLAEESEEDIQIKLAKKYDRDIDVEALAEVSKRIPKMPLKKITAYASYLKVIANYIEENGLLNEEIPSLSDLIKEYIRKNISKKISLSALSLQFHYSTVTLTETFKRECGISIMNYLLEERLKLATEKLADSKNSISEISDMCGFSGIEYFSKCFKDKYGVSPKKWREKELRGK